MPEVHDFGRDELFSSAVIDLGSPDLSGLPAAENPVLCAAIERVRTEIASGVAVTASCESSLRAPDIGAGHPEQGRKVHRPGTT
jgi:hypothetical protein